MTEDFKYVYDDWRCLAELNASNNALQRSYGWGLDLSGTLGGAGGVGGLLWMNSVANDVHFHAMDGNGNVIALIKATDGTVSANYEYDPFGQKLRETGPACQVNSYQFSTKRSDKTTDLVLYEYRIYNPSTGRFLSRDPIEEDGGSSFYATVGNDLLDRFDPLGLYEYDSKTKTFYVGKCEILIVFGHGSAKNPFKFQFEGQHCGAAGVSMCSTDKQLKDVDEHNRLPGQEPVGIQIIWNAPKKGLIRDRIESDKEEGVMPADGDAVLASLEQSVGAKAKEMCASCRCKSIAVRYYRSAKDKDKKKDIPTRSDVNINCKDIQ